MEMLLFMPEGGAVTSGDIFRGFCYHGGSLDKRTG